MRHALIAGLALGLTACAMPYQQQRNNPAGASVKVVDAKSPPATLYAVDRSVCLVTVDRYRSVRVGDAVYCLWRGGNETAQAPVAPPGPS